MRRTWTSALLLGLSSLVAAIFKDEVDDVDFHYPLVGIPQIDTTFFHRPRTEDRASLLYTLSDVGVIGAVNPGDGSLVWRQQIHEDAADRGHGHGNGNGSGRGHLRAPEGQNWLAAAHGSRVQAWNALTGRNIWHAEFAGEVRDLEIMELTESSRKDVLVLFEEEGGVTVLRRLHGALGSVVWEFRETTKDVPLQVSTNIANVFVIGIHADGLKVTSLEPATGGRIAHAAVSTKGAVRGPQDVKFVGANSAAPILAWTDRELSTLHVQVIGAKSVQEFALPPKAVSVDIHAPHLTSSQAHFLVHTRTDEGNVPQVYHTDLKSGRITKAYDLPLLPGRGAISTSSEGANVFFCRIENGQVEVFSSDSPDVLASWPLEAAVGGASLHAVSEVIWKASGRDLAVRSAIVTQTDDWVLFRNGELDWTRPEGMSGAVAAAWAEIPEAENLAKVLAEEAHTNPWNAYTHRVSRHVHDLQYLPAYLASLPALILNSVTGGAVKASPSKGLRRDSFGFNQIIILATQRGRVYALDTGNHGSVVWSKALFPQTSGSFFAVRGLVSNGQGLATIRGSRGEYAVFKVDDGEIVEINAGDDSVEVASTALVDGKAGKWLLALGPDGSPIDNGVLDINADKTLVIRTEDDTIKGITLSQEGDEVVKTETWQMQLLPGQRIVDIATPPSHDPTASIGRVLGDRTVNYKYLNPNTILIAIVEEGLPTLSVRVIDTVSGQILTTQKYNGVDTQEPISCTMSENWFSCAFFGQYTLDDGTDRLIKGYHLAVSDMYESPSPNDRGPLGDADTFSPLDPVDTPTGVPLPHVISQTWIVSEPLTRLTVTQTRQGITTRQILAYLPGSHAIMSIARFIVDPRRPVGRDPTAAEMEAESLIRYTPAIDMDARNFLTHERDIVGVRGIIATQAIVESTTLVVSYGVDVFGTRVAPSGMFDILGKGFNKITLIGTVVALGWGVVFLAPMVRKKQINRRWEAFL
ncbi:ER membrane protein complex subunit 1 [Escovopsis weberi]|uniref:ER membrane protein complex subunit 1 n=1 Tax=Escovopsis weberi TaxID=150374 RepID=A0A0M8N2T8_ESCWE|nr:ER membrane protein complex subunit 1 [Escovopsis weberi]